MRILIVGGGGLGTVLAGFLSRGGAEVTLLVKPEHAAAFEEPCIRITGSVEFEAPVRVVTGLSAMGHVDYTIVCVKGQDTRRALDALADLDSEVVLSMQNGVLKDDLLVQQLGRGRVLGAVTGIAGTLMRPGVAFHPFAGNTGVGESDGTTSDRCLALASALEEGGLPAAAVTVIRRREWYKLAGFLRTALVCSIVRRDIAIVAADPDLSRVCAGVAMDVAAVAAAEGEPLWQFSPHLGGFGTADLDPAADPTRPWQLEDVVEGLRLAAVELQRRDAVVYPSLTQDVMAGRPTELEFTAGDVLARAANHRIDVPALETCTRLLRGLGRAMC